MAKQNNRRSSYSSSKCPEPLNSLINIFGALFLGSWANKHVKKAYAKGQGSEAVDAANIVFGSSSMRYKEDSLMYLGGMIGANRAAREMEGVHKRRRLFQTADEINVKPFKAIDNTYAWQLNCNEGLDYGINPQKYVTKEQYLDALEAAKGKFKETNPQADQINNEIVDIEQVTSHIVCRVSCVDTGKNLYIAADKDLPQIGDIVLITDDAGIQHNAVILSVNVSGISDDEIAGTLESEVI